MMVIIREENRIKMTGMKNIRICPGSLGKSCQTRNKKQDK
jgi:hypothetical protein